MLANSSDEEKEEKIYHSFSPSERLPKGSTSKKYMYKPGMNVAGPVAVYPFEG